MNVNIIVRVDGRNINEVAKYKQELEEWLKNIPKAGDAPQIDTVIKIDKNGSCIELELMS